MKYLPKHGKGDKSLEALKLHLTAKQRPNCFICRARKGLADKESGNKRATISNLAFLIIIKNTKKSLLN